ncbi:unnamed protein product [Agarophyton chilense]
MTGQTPNSKIVESATNELANAISTQFKTAARVAAIDLDTIKSMNSSTETFYAGMNERISALAVAADQVQSHAEDAKKFASDMAALLTKARRLEALVNRLDEYTMRQESALSRKQHR